MKEIHGRVAAWTGAHGSAKRVATRGERGNRGRMNMAAARVEKTSTVAQPVPKRNHDEGGGPWWT